MSTGGAFYTESETELMALLQRDRRQGLKVKGGDSLVIKGEPVVDFFRDGANRLPLPAESRATTSSARARSC